VAGEEADLKKGDMVRTPRFCTVRITKVFTSPDRARKEGFTEPTHYENAEYNILGKHTGLNRMIFAAIKKQGGQD
jgi:hypothetical protein